MYIHVHTCTYYHIPHSKGDFDGAIAQYKLTIGTLEPSYVIRKVSGNIIYIIIIYNLLLIVFGCSENS